LYFPAWNPDPERPSEDLRSDVGMSAATQFPAGRDYSNDPRYRAMFDAAEIGIAICRLDGRILEANPALSRMLGYSPPELAEAHAGVLHAEIGRQPCSADFSSDQLGALIRGERDWFQVEQRYRRKDGSELWGSLTVSLARDARRQPAFLIATLADATDRRRVEEHLREAAKMEVIGRLAGGIAHDFNNLLTGILLYCDLLSAGLDGTGVNVENGNSPRENEPNPARDDSQGNDPLELDRSRNHHSRNQAVPHRDLYQHVNQVRIAGEQGAALTHQLLAIARQQAAEPRPVLINEVVASTENLLRRLLGEQVDLIVKLDSAAGPVLADKAQMGQVLLNLVLNARDSMPKGGKIWLMTRPADFPSAESPGHSSAELLSNLPPAFACNSAGNYATNSKPEESRSAVSLMVKDNGCGMNAETRRRLFEPFFTTKDPGKGTGLGLATVQRIVAEAGGRIAVESAEGCGTCIEVFFPVIEPPNEELQRRNSVLGAPE
jgi:two-component system, cell cycle sensor histidine kinase and response regulator CckA